MTATGDPVDVRPHTVAAFVGRALRGPLNTPILLRSFAQFCREFGGLWNEIAWQRKPIIKKLGLHIEEANLRPTRKKAILFMLSDESIHSTDILE
jgi:hypothetical protein